MIHWIGFLVALGAGALIVINLLFLDPETMEPYSGPVFQLSPIDPTVLVLRGLSGTGSGTDLMSSISWTVNCSIRGYTRTGRGVASGLLWKQPSPFEPC